MIDTDATKLPGGLLVMRNDGLGARLMPILNARRLAQLLDIPLYIYWPTYLIGHNTTEVDTLFHADFRAASFLEATTYQDIQKARTIRSETEIAQLSGDDVKAACADGAFFFFDNTEHDVALLGEDAQAVKTGLSKALPDHLMSDAVATLMTDVKARLKANPPLVYHVRHGDLTHSYKTRASEWTNKYIPNEIYLAHMRENGIGPDKPAVIIGDCHAAIDWIIARQPGVSGIGNMLKTAGLGSLQFDFMELYTMSCAAKIVCPEHSGFSKMAARIGNLPIEDVKHSLSDAARTAALADLEKRLWTQRDSFTNDGDAAQSMLHLKAPLSDKPTAAIDGLARREITAGSTVPFLFRYQADAALRAGDTEQLTQTADQTHAAMINDPPTIAAVNALAAQGMLQTGNIDTGLYYLRRATYLMPTIPQIGAPLLNYLQSSDTAHLHPDFYPSGFSKHILSYAAAWRIVLVQGFAWEVWPFLQDRFRVLLTRGHIFKTFLIHTQKLKSVCAAAGDTAATSMLDGLLHLVRFYQTQDSTDLAALTQLAQTSDLATDPIPTQRLALAHLFIKDIPQARALLDNLVDAYPENRAYQGLLGHVLLVQKSSGPALQHFERANPVAVDFARFAAPHIRMADRAKQTDAAHALFMSLLKETAWNDVHLTHYCRRALPRDHATAIIDKLTAALPLMENARPTHAQLAALYAGLGDTANAAAHFIRALDLGLIPPVLADDAATLAAKIDHPDLNLALKHHTTR